MSPHPHSFVSSLRLFCAHLMHLMNTIVTANITIRARAMASSDCTDTDEDQVNSRCAPAGDPNEAVGDKKDYSTEHNRSGAKRRAEPL